MFKACLTFVASDRWVPADIAYTNSKQTKREEIYFD